MGLLPYQVGRLLENILKSNMKSIVYILFDQAHSYLGELFIDEGVFSHLAMTPEGEHALGEKFEEWQMRGIPMLPQNPFEAPSTKFTHDGRVLLRDVGSMPALLAWLKANMYYFLPMGIEALDCWETVLQLPLEPNEYFALAEDLSLVPVEEIGAWKRTFQDAAVSAKLAAH